MALPQWAQDSFNNVDFMNHVSNAASILSGSYVFLLTGEIKYYSLV